MMLRSPFEKAMLQWGRVLMNAERQRCDELVADPVGGIERPGLAHQSPGIPERRSPRKRRRMNPPWFSP